MSRGKGWKNSGSNGEREETREGMGGGGRGGKGGGGFVSVRIDAFETGADINRSQITVLGNSTDIYLQLLPIIDDEAKNF